MTRDFIYDRSGSRFFTLLVSLSLLFTRVSVRFVGVRVGEEFAYSPLLFLWLNSFVTTLVSFLAGLC